LIGAFPKIFAIGTDYIRDIKEFGNQLLRGSTSGFPEWYKKQLMEQAMKGE
jgi:hypothetical protein